jgi:uncharacterized membrane protein YhhN
LRLEGMTAVASVLLALALVAAVVDWVAVATGRRPLEWVAKPATLALLVGVAVTLHPEYAATRAWFVAGLVASLAGDVFLMLPRERFIEGLAAFFVGHVCYVVGFWFRPQHAGLLVVGLVVVAVGAATLGRHIVRAVRAGDEPGLMGPVLAYLLVISAMVASAIGSGDAWAMVGALLFFASDGTLAWNKFVSPFKGGRLAVIVTYHLGQLGLVLSLLP